MKHWALPELLFSLQTRTQRLAVVSELCAGKENSVDMRHWSVPKSQISAEKMFLLQVIDVMLVISTCTNIKSFI